MTAVATDEKLTILRAWPYSIYKNDPKYPEIQAKCQKFIDDFNAIKWRADCGKPIYVKVLSGDWKGSIAKLNPTRWTTPKYIKLIDREEFRGEIGGNLYWDGRRNSVKFSTFNNTVVWLENYNGPTVYCKIDRKAANAKLISRFVIKDRNGNILNIGDNVIYADIRYGEGTSLEFGKISEFIVKSSVVYVVVKNNENSVLSTIKCRNATSLIMKT